MWEHSCIRLLIGDEVGSDDFFLWFINDETDLLFDLSMIFTLFVSWFGIILLLFFIEIL
jgi:hypothetical protein